ncbi:MAG: porin [Holosporales bacterium]|jgi:hypothetical protein|nr:porin [Holosporales bacterium]
MKKAYLVGCLAVAATQCVVVGKPRVTFYGGAQGVVTAVSGKYKYYKGGDPEQENDDKVSRSSFDTGMPRIVGGETYVGLKAAGAMKNGVEFGALIELDAIKNDTGVAKAYVWFGEVNYGIIQIGNVKDSAATYLFGGQQLLGGTGGVDGILGDEAEFATGVTSPVYMIGYTNKATKIAYYSPRFYGLQVSCAVTPDTKHAGHDSRNRGTGSSKVGNDPGLFIPAKKDGDKPSGRMSMSFGLSHRHEWTPKVRTEFAVVYLRENTRSITLNYAGQDHVIKLKNASSYHITTTLRYGDFAIGVGYIDSGKSRTPRNFGDFRNEGEDNDDTAIDNGYGGFLCRRGGNAGKAYNVGVRYTRGDWMFAAAYNHAWRKFNYDQKTKGDVITLTADYKICDGFGAFVEVSHIDSRSCSEACAQRNAFYNIGKAEADWRAVAIKKQSTQVYAVGVKVNF